MKFSESFKVVPLSPSKGKISLGAVAIAVAVVAVLVFLGFARSHSSSAPKTVDTGLCPFPLDISVSRKGTTQNVLQFAFGGPATITLRNGTTGQKASLKSTGTSTVNTAGGVDFDGHQIWYWATGKRVPFLATDGAGSIAAPNFVVSSPREGAHVIDPCALVASTPPSTRPRTTLAPWGLPRFALSQIGYAGLIPLRGTLYRHDHVHVDLFVDGKKVTIPAGIGLAEPKNSGPCPSEPLPQGDCTTGAIYTAQVANSPIHTHSTSGLIHIEADRPGAFTLGQFFDEWGVRLTPTCLGGYCTGGGKELRAYVDGKPIAGNPRGIVLTNHQEIALVFGSPADFRSIPASYAGGWPGLGCGGSGETSCLPP